MALALAGALAGAARGDASPTVVPGAASDVRYLAEQMEAIHPDLYATVSRARFRSAVKDLAARADRLSENELLVGLMRIAALPGTGNGHTGISPADPGHLRPMHLYPFRLYTFPEGTVVVDAKSAPGLIGARMVAIGKTPYSRVEQLVRPLVPHDNAGSLRGLLPHYALSAEVLDGLGIVDGTDEASFTFKARDGKTIETTASPLLARDYVSAFADPHVGHYPSVLPRRKPAPVYLRKSTRALWVGTADRGRAVVVGYNAVTVPTSAAATRLLALAKRPGVHRVIVDVRLNGGGDNTTYGPLLAALETPSINRRGCLFVLIGRATFSAAANFAADVDRSTKAAFVGEPTGGGIKIYGDAVSFLLPKSGIAAHVAKRYWDFGKGRGDRRLAVYPDISVPVHAADFLAGRDPVLAAAFAAK